jgi:transposase-like protein
VLYLRGISTGDFQEALAALLGKDAPNLSLAVVARLKEEWAADDARWPRRDQSARRYVYVRADGVYLQACMEPAADGMLVIIGATSEGRKELIGFQVDARENAQLPPSPRPAAMLSDIWCPPCGMQRVGNQPNRSRTSRVRRYSTKP